MIRYSNEPPEVQAYCDLRVKAGMSPKSVAAARNGLPNGCFNITIYEDQQLIGMGRVIGDGGTTFQIVDIAVIQIIKDKVMVGLFWKNNGIY